VLDAVTGALLWSAGNSSMSPTVSVSNMDFSIAADVLAVDRTLDGYADRVYMADVGGNVWRVDLTNNMNGWAVWQIASLASRNSVASTRKFLFSADVVFGTSFDSVVVGSGDREHPLAASGSYAVVNRAYMLKDPNTGVGGADLGLFDTCGATLSTSCTNLFFDTATNNTVPSSASGWLFTLPNPGEKIINGPIVIAGNMIFGTNQPCASGKLNDDGTCSTSSGGTLSCTGNLGVARRYDISYLNGAPELYTNSGGTYVASQVATGGGFLPSPVAGVVEIGSPAKRYIFVTDNPLNPGGIIKPVINVPQKRFRNYWKEKLE
jgi:type IV pilus assembly protein PilY1